MNNKRKVCVIEDCGLPVVARGWCSAHYNRWRDNGDPTLLVGRRKEQAHPNWKGNAAQWPALRARVRSKRGRATAHECHHCGRPARGWGYNGGTDGDPTDVMQWVPRCHGCRLSPPGPLR